MHGRLAGEVRAEAEFQFSGRAADELRSPLYDALARHTADDGGLLTRIAESNQPNVRLLLAAVHLVLLEGVEHSLAEWYPSVSGRRLPDHELIDAFEDFVARHDERLRAVMAERNVQTNEVRRCATLLPTLSVVEERAGRPLGLVELGCSAGLILLFDRYGYDYGTHGSVGDPASSVRISCEVRGDIAPPIPSRMPEVGFRLGVDIHPVDPHDEAEVRWLRACIWGDHAERLRQFDQALNLARTARPPVLAGDMIDLVPEAIEQVPPDLTAAVFHSNAVNYLPPDGREALREALHAASRQRPLIWVSIEGPWVFPDHPAPEDALEKFAVTVVVTILQAGRGEPELFALAGAHGGWLEWRGR